MWQMSCGVAHRVLGLVERRTDSQLTLDSEGTVTTTQDGVWLEGTLNSHSKRNNRGMFHTVDGRHIPYRYLGDELQPLLRGCAYNGVVRVFGKVKLDANGEPISNEIRSPETLLKYSSIIRFRRDNR
jgi:hypothetical protein